MDKKVKTIVGGAVIVVALISGVIIAIFVKDGLGLAIGLATGGLIAGESIALF